MCPPGHIGLADRFSSDTGEKVVITILLARIFVHSVAPISITYVLVAQFVHRVHGNTNKSQRVWY